MPISYKNKIYTTLGTPTELSGDVVSATDSAGVPAKDYTVKGKTIVWNQLLDKSKYPVTTTTNGVTFTNNGDGTYTVTGTASQTTTAFIQNFTAPMPAGHVYYMCGIPESAGSTNDMRFGAYSDSAGVFFTYNTIITASSTFNNVRIIVNTGRTVNNVLVKPQLFDLTQMFGAGNEPATPEEFRAMFPDDYYPYNAGELKSIMPTSVEASTINLLNLVGRKEISSDTVGRRTPTDAYPEIDTHVYYRGISPNGYLSASSIVEATILSSSVIAKTGTSPGSHSYGVGIPLTAVPSTTYYIKCTTSGEITVGFANSNKIITAFGPVLSNGQFTTPRDCRYILIVFKPGALDTVATFENICVSTVQTNEYQPYNKYRANIPSSKYFPDGMRSAGSAYDEINFLSQKAIKRVGVRAYQTGDENDANVMTDKINTVYILSTPIETTITPPLQALSTYKGFTSFSAPNSLTQNGPLSVTYYAEGGTNPEGGWLTSYKRKLYMGRNIEWNQLLGRTNRARVTYNGVTVELQDDGSYVVNGTATDTAVIQLETSNFSTVTGHKYLVTGCPKNGSTQSFRMYDAWSGQYTDFGDGVIFVASVGKVTSNSIAVTSGYTCTNLIFKPQLFDLTQMFGAGNEPTTPEEFWSYFDHKLYPYNAGEIQPLFKISRKSQWGALPKHYTARWDKVNAAMVRLNDAASFPTDVTNFAYRGSVNANYSNPFDNIYPWSGIKLCNISIDLYRNLAAGDSITKCVTAWEGDANFSYNDTNGVWRYRPEFWGKSWEDDTYRYFDVTDQNVHGSNYVHYPEAIVGRWHGRNETLTIGGAEKTCLVPSVGMPAKNIVLSTLHTYAKNYGATIDSIFSIDADVLLCIVEFATMNTQKAIGNGATSMYRQSSDLIAEDATNSNVVKVLASAASAFCIPGAIFDIGTSDGGVQVGSYHVVSVQPNIGDAQYLDVTLNEAVTVTAANYWSVHGIINVADEEIGSKSGYIGTNGKCNSYYRGLVLFGNMWLYTLGAYESGKDKHIWIANSDEEADNYDALNTGVHYDTGLVLSATAGYTKKLGMLSRSGLLSIPAFCTEIGGDSNNPTGDYCYGGNITYNAVFVRGGDSNGGSIAGAFFGNWYTRDVISGWNYAARPRLKKPLRGLQALYVGEDIIIPQIVRN